MKVIVLFLCLIVNSCCALDKGEKLLNNILYEHAIDQRKNGYVMIGSGGSYPDKIRWFTVDLRSNKRIGIEEARRIAVNSTELLLKRINANEEIRPYLSNYPFTVKNVNYKIGFEDRRNNFVSPPYVALILVTEGSVTYCYHNPDELGFNSNLDKDEPYEEALRIVREEEKAKLAQQPKPSSNPTNNQEKK